MKKKILAYACDHGYFEYTRASFASFSEHHSLSNWRIIFADVGLYPWQKAELANFGEVVEYKPCHLKQQRGFIFTAARARIGMLMDFVRDDTVLLYLDSDTLIYENLDDILTTFVNSKKSIAILIEDIIEFWRTPASHGWRNRKIPEELKNQDKWRVSPMANTGVLLVQEPGARQIAEMAMDLYERHGDQVLLAEQTVISSLLYEHEIPFMKLTPKYHCLAFENYITHIGKGRKYLQTKPFFRGESVAIRHFAGRNRVCKAALDKALPLMNTNAQLLRFIEKT